jgi:hypothetical protein
VPTITIDPERVLAYADREETLVDFCRRHLQDTTAKIAWTRNAANVGTVDHA